MKQLLVESTIEKIRTYYAEGEEKVMLSPKEDRIRKRIHSAYLFMMDSRVATEKNVVKKLVNTFKIGETQAYLDIRNAQVIFGSIKKAEKEMLRHIVTQWAMQLYQTGEKEKDRDLMSKALDKMIRANSLDNEDVDLPDPSKIQPPVQLLSINFNFIDSPWFSKIDPEVQKGLLELREKFNAMVANSPLRDYVDMFNKPNKPELLTQNDDECQVIP